MADIELVIKIDEEDYKRLKEYEKAPFNSLTSRIYEAIANGTPLTPTVLAHMLMDERIRGKLDSNTTFEKDVIDDVKCKLTVSIIDHRPCYCGAELREVWREGQEESEAQDASSD